MEIGLLHGQNGIDLEDVQSMATRTTSVKELLGQKKHSFLLRTSTFAYRKNLDMALRVAFLCCIFGLPVLSFNLFYVFFGDDDDMCLKRYGRWVHGESGFEPYDEPLGKFTGEYPQVWCGYLPKAWASSWPNVVQMIVYTVAPNCGTTIRQAWQGVVGMFWATANNWVMMCIWPKGPLSPGYQEWFCWIDLVAVIALFLISSSDTNTIKFGLSWHVVFMMEFMNPTTGPNISESVWDSEVTATLLTGFTGALVAVLAVYCPFPWMEMSDLASTVRGISKKVGKEWRRAIDYQCGEEPSPMAVSIKCHMNMSSSLASDFDLKLAMSWFETWDIDYWNNFGKKRAMYKILSGHLQNLTSVMQTAGVLVKEAKFKKAHQQFFTPAIHRRLLTAHEHASELYLQIADFIEDGEIDDEEQELCSKTVQNLENSLHQFLLEYKENWKEISGKVCAPKHSSSIYFLYCFSWWAEIALQLADEITAQGINWRRGKSVTDKETIARAAVKSLKETWSRESVSKNWRKALQSTLSITLAFWIGRSWNNGIFVENDSTMAGSLGLLFHRYQGSGMENAFKRLMGVTLGKVIPIMMLSLAHLFRCGTTIHFWWNVAGIFLYMVACQYATMASHRYGGMAMNAAAFGATFLFTRCSSSNQSATYQRNYQDIGQIVFAVFIDHVLGHLFRKCNFIRSVRRKTLDTFVELKLRTRELMDIVVNPHNTLGNPGAIAEKLKALETILVAAEALIPECDPQKQIVQGAQCDFKNVLYASAVQQFRYIMDDIRIFDHAVHSGLSRGDHLKRKMSSGTEYAPCDVYREELMELFDTSTTICHRVLEHNLDGPYAGHELKDVRGQRKLIRNELAKKAAEQLNMEDFQDEPAIRFVRQARQVRMSVIQESLENVYMHLGDLCDIAIEQNYAQAGSHYYSMKFKEKDTRSSRNYELEINGSQSP